MLRVPEPDLMNEAEQVLAYAEADFSEPHGRFLEALQRVWAPPQSAACAVDLGCGPGDITLRLAQAFPSLMIHGLDGAPRMLDYARNLAAKRGLTERVTFHQAYLPELGEMACRPAYDLLISNSLLHHLNDPGVLWRTIKTLGRKGAFWFVVDLRRPANEAETEALVATYAALEPAVLQRDFSNSLQAAYREDEVRAQLDACGLSAAAVLTLSDRHWLSYGYC